MKKILFMMLTVSIITAVSCAPGRDKMTKKIAAMEAEMKASSTVDTIAMKELLSAYQNFSSRFPGDSLAPKYLYKAAGLAVGFKRGQQAVDLYQQLIDKYPSYAKIPECYFMQAFTYENTIGNFGKASELYNTFISRYPNHDLADDAQAALKYLGKSPEEMIRDFEKQASADSAVVSK